MYRVSYFFPFHGMKDFDWLILCLMCYAKVSVFLSLYLQSSVFIILQIILSQYRQFTNSDYVLRCETGE